MQQHRISGTLTKYNCFLVFFYKKIENVPREPKIIVGAPHFFRWVYVRKGKFSLNFNQIGILEQKLQSFTLGTAQRF